MSSRVLLATWYQAHTGLADAGTCIVSWVFRTACLAVQVQADVRTILSRDFATRHSLRFPRVERIRYDKSPFDVQTDKQLWDLVNQNKGGMIGV